MSCERHTGRHLGGGALADDHRDYAESGDSCRTEGVGRRFSRQTQAAGAAGATGAACITGAGGTAGDGNGTINDDDRNDAGATNGTVAGGVVTVIPTGDQKSSGQRGSLDNELLKTGRTLVRMRAYHQGCSGAS
eukprot:jgi/Undpi1/6336/HiC_scaffold_20.g08819.m1